MAGCGREKILRFLPRPKGRDRPSWQARRVDMQAARVRDKGRPNTQPDGPPRCCCVSGIPVAGKCGSELRNGLRIHGLKMSTTTCQHCGGFGVVDYIQMPCPQCNTKDTTANWKKLAGERAEDLVALKTQMVELAQGWRCSAAASKMVGEQHSRIYGEQNKEYAEHEERCRTLHDCVEHLSAALENYEPLPSPVNPSGTETADKSEALSHGQKVEPAMLALMAWLIRGRYRSIQHRHNGIYRATDEANGDEWDSDCAVGLLELMQERKAS